MMRTPAGAPAPSGSPPLWKERPSMSYRNRALVALALTGALTVSGIVAAGVARAKTSRKTTTTESSSKGDGYLGVNLQELSDGLADSYDYKGSGVVVTSVVPGSPADDLGIEEGD